jgi:hypothetical protein
MPRRPRASGIPAGFPANDHFDENGHGDRSSFWTSNGEQHLDLQMIADFPAKIAQGHNGGGHRELADRGRSPGRAGQKRQTAASQKRRPDKTRYPAAGPGVPPEATQLLYDISRHL